MNMSSYSYYMNQEIRFESNEQVEEMECLEVEKLFSQPKVIKLNV